MLGKGAAVLHKLKNLGQRSSGFTNTRDKFEDIYKLTESTSPVIADVGAAVDAGDDWTDNFLRLFENPSIHSFEPRPDAATDLRDLYKESDSVSIYECALGSEQKEIEIHIAEYGGNTSPLEWNDKSSSELTETNRNIQVPQCRIDNVLEGLDILKLDIEGYELEAIKGAESLLPTIKIIACEIQFVERFDGSPLFSDIINYISEYDFRIYNLYDVRCNEDGQLTIADALFIKNDLIRNQ
jgi:FkbM family methyltransferase